MGLLGGFCPPHELARAAHSLPGHCQVIFREQPMLCPLTGRVGLLVDPGLGVSTECQPWRVLCHPPRQHSGLRPVAGLPAFGVSFGSEAWGCRGTQLSPGSRALGGAGQGVSWVVCRLLLGGGAGPGSPLGGWAAGGSWGAQQRCWDPSGGRSLSILLVGCHFPP